jgi:hypothetical protein
MSVFNNTTIWCIPAIQSSSKSQYQINGNGIGGEVHNILSYSWSTVTETSTITKNATTLTPRE